MRCLSFLFFIFFPDCKSCLCTSTSKTSCFAHFHSGSTRAAAGQRWEWRCAPAVPTAGCARRSRLPRSFSFSTRAGNPLALCSESPGIATTSVLCTCSQMLWLREVENKGRVLPFSSSAVYKLLFPNEPLYLLSAALLASFVTASCKPSFPSCPLLSHYFFACQ